MPVHAVKIHVGRTRDFTPGSSRAIDLLQLSIAVICLSDGTFHAIHNRCPYGGTVVSGKISDHSIICTNHDCRIDVRTGKLLSSHIGEVETFPIEIEDGLIYVTLE
ncbi:Rieske (2Fe-2S) protein [Alkalihalobacillus hwajinpoensis]|uniref:Rieske 2Fe-2S domain-containing protein n=1 Tax=Guptibacillus hwajinpoensis TaxID=208199 RepID=UPI00188422D6|nr:Rieske (2Fe-2S) protein [Pseudalkalibacillus hwajinpoensis]MBF0707897.1 Rieske (2Fe-2S) protein [Pseudalkalibacillus hwajinpoensis]